MNQLSSAFLLVIMLAIAQFSFSQNANIDTLRPAPNSLGVVVNATGLISNINAAPRQDLLNSSSMLLRYTMNDKWSLRLGLAPSIRRTNFSTTDSVGKDLVEYDSTSSQSIFGIYPGVEYHLQGTKRLDPYFAGELELGLVGRLNISAVQNSTDTTGTSRITRTITEDGGYAVGARLRLGMNYFIAPNVFLGVEYGLGFSTLISGGDREDVLQSEPISGASTVVRTLSAARRNDLYFGIDPMVQITFGYYFGF